MRVNLKLWKKLHRRMGFVISTMKALILSEYKQFSIADLPVPVCAAREVLIRVAACGICGSDVHGYDGSSGRRIPPIVMGHEAAGVVAAVGEGLPATGSATESPSTPRSTAASVSSASAAK